MNILIYGLAVIHSARKRSGRRNTVYGVATDGENFEFSRMSTDPVTGETLVSQSEDKLVGNALTQKKVGPECGYMGPVALA